MKLKLSVFSKFFLMATTGLFVTACNTPQSDTKTPPTKSADMSSPEMVKNIMSWWQGDYNNDAQITALKEDGAPIWQKDVEGATFGGHLPISSYYRRVDMPAFGENVLYLEEFSFKENPYRQRIYTVKHHEDTNEVRIKLWYFPDKTTYAGAWKDVSRIKDLKPEDMSPLPDNCDLYVTQAENGRLEMTMPKDQCKFGKSIFDYQVSLSSDDFWFRDRIVNAETMRVKSTAGSFQFHTLDRVTP